MELLAAAAAAKAAKAAKAKVAVRRKTRTKQKTINPKGYRRISLGRVARLEVGFALTGALGRHNGGSSRRS
jgi:hypothetical protein